MSIDLLVSDWRSVRDGFIAEVETIGADKFEFKATPETRSIAELIQHIIEAQKVLVGEMCRPDTNLRRAPFPELIKEYASEVKGHSDKAGLVSLLKSSQDSAEATMQSCGEAGLQVDTQRLDGKTTTKLGFLQFIVAHEMYHRGQLTVYQRLLGIEPALTTLFKKMFAKEA